MIPKYPFMVETTYAKGQERIRALHNYETLDGAYSYSAIVMRKANTIRVRVLMIIDEREVRNVTP